MPQPRKLTSRSGNAGASRQSTDDRSMPNFPTEVSPPRHAHIPAIPHDCELGFYFLSLLFSICSTCMQYLHLYRTVWWLPHSHAKYAVNFYLIDLHLFGYLLAMETLPVLHVVYKQIRDHEMKRICFIFCTGFFLLIAFLWVLLFIFFSFHVYIKTSGTYLLLLVYPPITYALVYYGHVPGHLLERFRTKLPPSLVGSSGSNSLSNSPTHSPSSQSPVPPPLVSNSTTPPSPNPGRSFSPSHNGHNHSNNNHSAFSSLYTNNNFINGATNLSGDHLYTTDKKSSVIESLCTKSCSMIHSLRHNCSSNPEEIRDETEMLKLDFNRRLRDVLFSTLFVAFYASLVPLMFVPGTVHYDGIWCGQHVFVTAVTAFLLSAVHHLPPAYVDLMHRCALHLGKWQKEEARSAYVPYNAWSELQVFPQGALVKHVKGLFRAVGINNSAEPGNSMHSRFFHLFYPPLRLINCLCFLVVSLILFQFFLIINSYEWYKLLSVALMIFFNFVILYKLLRNRILLGRCYKEESLGNSHPHTD